MKLLLLCIPFASFVWADSNGTNTNTSTRNYVENSNAPTFVTPMTMGGGDVLPMNNTVTANSATCASNQLIFEAVNTHAGLRGSGAPKIGNYGYAFGAKVVIPWGDDGNCKGHAKAIARDAKLMGARNTNKFCNDAAAEYKKRGQFLKDDFWEAYPNMNGCRMIFVYAGVTYKLQGEFK